MMNLLANKVAVNLTGTMAVGQLGDGLTGSCIHTIFCVSAGTITIGTLKDSFTWGASAGQTIDIVPNSVTVTSGAFIGIKAPYYPQQGVSTNYASA